MVRRCETLLLVMVVAIGCRRAAPPPAPPHPPRRPRRTHRAAAAEPRGIAAPPGRRRQGGDEAAKIEAAKNKEAPPDKTAASGGEHRGTDGGRRAQRARPASPRRRCNPRASSAARTRTAAKAARRPARQEARSSPRARRSPPRLKPRSTPPVQATLRFKNEAGANYKLVEARFVMDGAELPTVITSAPARRDAAGLLGPGPRGPPRGGVAAHVPGRRPRDLQLHEGLHLSREVRRRVRRARQERGQHDHRVQGEDRLQRPGRAPAVRHRRVTRVSDAVALELSPSRDVDSPGCSSPGERECRRDESAIGRTRR